MLFNVITCHHREPPALSSIRHNPSTILIHHPSSIVHLPSLIMRPSTIHVPPSAVHVPSPFIIDFIDTIIVNISWLSIVFPNIFSPSGSSQASSQYHSNIMNATSYGHWTFFGSKRALNEKWRLSKHLHQCFAHFRMNSFVCFWRQLDAMSPAAGVKVSFRPTRGFQSETFHLRIFAHKLTNIWDLQIVFDCVGLREIRFRAGDSHVIPRRFENHFKNNTGKKNLPVWIFWVYFARNLKTSSSKHATEKRFST